MKRSSTEISILSAKSRRWTYPFLRRSRECELMRTQASAAEGIRARLQRLRKNLLFKSSKKVGTTMNSADRRVKKVAPGVARGKPENQGEPRRGGTQDVFPLGSPLSSVGAFDKVR